MAFVSGCLAIGGGLGELLEGGGALWEFYGAIRQIVPENRHFVDCWLKIFCPIFLLCARKGITFVPIKENQTDDDATTSHISEPKAG
jgi:hypothetical protein